MTEFQEKQIRDLRLQGTGYRAIASVVGLSRDIVRNYCKSHGLDGYASVLTINMKEQMMKGQACLACGKEIEQPMTGRKRKFCSDECRRRWWAAHQADLKKKPTAFYEKECAYCHKSFVAYGNKNRKYCSHECYVRDRFFREEEGRQPYARVSSGKDAMLHSLAAQVDYYSTYIRSHPGWEYVGVYADEAKTGTKDKRDEFQRMLSDCRSGKIDHIITKSISRFARNTVTLLETVRELKKLGISVFFEEQNIDTSTADGELMLSILASFAQEESLSASENQKWRVRQNFENGQPWRGFMLGYRYENGVYIVVPEEAAIVRSIYADFLDGKGVIAIMKRLNAEGVLTQQGYTWHKSAVTRILKNYAYTGNLLLQTKYRENHLTKRTLVNHGQLPQYHAKDTHEAIIDIDTYNAVQLEMHRRAEKYGKPQSSRKYPFSGMITCANCGKHYRRKVTATGPVWICSTYNTLGKSACPSKAIPESTLTALAAEVSATGEITAITARNDNTLVFTLADGTQTVKQWQDRSRAESWTDEMRSTAGQKTKERKQNHA